MVFAYHIVDTDHVRDFEATFEFRSRVYAFYGVWADAYRDQMRQRSASWETVSLPRAVFRELRQPISEML